MGAISSRICLVSRILSSPGGDGDHSSGPFVTERLERPTRKRRPSYDEHGTGPIPFVFLFGLAPRGVYLAAGVTTDAGELLPHRFTHYLKKRLVYSLLHLSSPAIYGRPDVIRLAALRCSDFPLLFREAITRHVQLLGLSIIAKNC